MKSLLKVPANAIDRLTPDALELDCALRARGMDDVADELLLAKLEPGIVGVQVTGVASADPPIQYSQQPIDHPYAKGKAINLGVTTLGASTTTSIDLVTAGYTQLTLLSRIGNATTPASALGDLSVFVCAYEDDGVTLLPPGIKISINTVAVLVATALSAPYAFNGLVFNLYGIDKVNLNLKNNNAGALQGATMTYFLQK